VTPKPFTDVDLNLEILGEEAAEIIEALAKDEAEKHLSRLIRIKSKIARFGLDDHHPKNKVKNRHALEEEIGHFMAIVDILADCKVISRDNIVKHLEKKRNTLGDYYFPMRRSNIEPLSCGLCGKVTRGRQWPRAEKGYGICPDCHSWLKKTCNDKKYLRDCYGMKVTTSTFRRHHDSDEQ